MEYFDIVDRNGKPTGETVERGIAHKDGIRHCTAHCWIVRAQNGRTEILLQKRALCKDSFPGRYDTSSAGHVQAGDTPLSSILRELSEELGITASAEELTYIGTFDNEYETSFSGKPFHDNELAFVYILKKEIDKDALVLQEDEVASVDWFDLSDTFAECEKHNKKFCVPLIGLDVLVRYLNAYRT